MTREDHQGKAPVTGIFDAPIVRCQGCGRKFSDSLPGVVGFFRIGCFAFSTVTCEPCTCELEANPPNSRVVSNVERRLANIHPAASGALEALANLKRNLPHLEPTKRDHPAEVLT